MWSHLTTLPSWVDRANNYYTVIVDACEVSKSAGLVVTSICIYPAEVNKSDSTVSIAVYSVGEGGVLGVVKKHAGCFE